VTHGLLLDTHVWAWIGNGILHPDPALVESINDAGQQDALFLSSISLYEMANAHQRGRLDLVGRTLEDWFTANLRKPGVRIIEISPEIALQTAKLPSGFHGDPGDRLVAATAQVASLTIVTHDKVLLRYGKQGVFPTLKARRKKLVS
jgi:PIN domain nuclease of toxin-antitoxin system